MYIHNCILTNKNKSVEEKGLSEALVDTVLYLVVAETRLHNLHLAPWGCWYDKNDEDFDFDVVLKKISF